MLFISYNTFSSSCRFSLYVVKAWLIKPHQKVYKIIFIYSAIYKCLLCPRQLNLVGNTIFFHQSEYSSIGTGLFIFILHSLHVRNNQHQHIISRAKR